MGNCRSDHYDHDHHHDSSPFVTATVRVKHITSTSASATSTNPPRFSAVLWLAKLLKKARKMPQSKLASSYLTPPTSCWPTNVPTSSEGSDGGMAVLILEAPLPHSRICQTLRMRRTPGWEHVVSPLITPGAQLQVVYDRTTLMIVGLGPVREKNEESIKMDTPQPLPPRDTPQIKGEIH